MFNGCREMPTCDLSSTKILIEKNITVHGAKYNCAVWTVKTAPTTKITTKFS